MNKQKKIHIISTVKHSNLYVSVNLTDLDRNALGVGRIEQDSLRSNGRGQAFRLYL